MKQRNDYQWGASQYLAHFEIGEVRIYNERFPWRSLHSIATRLKRVMEYNSSSILSETRR